MLWSGSIRRESGSVSISSGLCPFPPELQSPLRQTATVVLVLKHSVPARALAAWVPGGLRGRALPIDTSVPQVSPVWQLVFSPARPAASRGGNQSFCPGLPLND